MVLGGLTAICIALGAHMFFKDPKILKDFEENFHYKHRHAPKETVLLTLDSEERNYFIERCKKHVWKRSLRKHPPRVETHYLGFKQSIHHPYLTQLIRCSHKIGIIQSPHYHCAYLLKLGKRSRNFLGLTGKNEKNSPGLTFHIGAKFCYKIHADEINQRRANIARASLPSTPERLREMENMFAPRSPEPFYETDGTVFSPNREHHYRLREDGNEIDGVPYATRHPLDFTHLDQAGAYGPPQGYHHEMYPDNNFHQPYIDQHSPHRRTSPGSDRGREPRRYPSSHLKTYRPKSADREPIRTDDENDLSPRLRQNVTHDYQHHTPEITAVTK